MIFEQQQQLGINENNCSVSFSNWCFCNYGTNYHWKHYFYFFFKPGYQILTATNAAQQWFASQTRSSISECCTSDFIPHHQPLQSDLWWFNWVILTVVSSSWSTWSYPLRATQKIMAVTSSKQWIHFFLSDLCPPTSNSLQESASQCGNVGEIPRAESKTDCIRAMEPLPVFYLKWRFLNVKWVSTIPVVFTRVLKMSCSVGW